MGWEAERGVEVSSSSLVSVCGSDGCRGGVIESGVGSSRYCKAESTEAVRLREGLAELLWVEVWWVEAVERAYVTNPEAAEGGEGVASWMKKEGGEEESDRGR